MPLVHIVPIEAEKRTARFAVQLGEGRSSQDLVSDKMLNLSLTRLLEIVGEAAKAVSEELRQRFAEIPWSQIAGTRDIITHDHFDVDMDIIWHIVTEDLPPLIAQLEEVIKREFG